MTMDPIIYKYTLTPEKMKLAAHTFIKHRYKKWKAFTMGAGILNLAFGLYILSNGINDSIFGMGVMLVMIGLATVFRYKLTAHKIVKNIFLGKPNEIQIKLTATEDKLLIVTDSMESTAQWSNFVDHLVCDQGILVYQQKALFIWLPNDGTFASCDWNSLTKLIDSKITKKV